MNDFSRHQTLLGIFCMIGATLSLALMGTCVKQLAGHVPISQVLFFRFSFGLTLLLPFVFTLKSFSFRVPTPLHYSIRIISALLAVSASYFALQYISVADVYLLTNTAALFVPFVAALLLRVKLIKGVIATSSIGFIGAIMVLKPDSGIVSLPAIVAFASAIFVAISIVEVRLIGSGSTPLQMIFYYQLMGALCAGFVALFQWQPISSQDQLWLLMGVACFGFIYQWGLTHALNRASVRIISPLLFLSVIYGVIIDWLFWDHIPGLVTIIGMALVMAGAIATILYGQKVIYGKK